MISLDHVFQVQYARSAAMWQLLALILVKDGCWDHSGVRMMSMFWGDHQRFFKAMLMAAKVPALAEEALKAIQNEHSVVIGLQSTGEANLQSEKEKQGAYTRHTHSLVTELSCCTLLRLWRACFSCCACGCCGWQHMHPAAMQLWWLHCGTGTGFTAPAIIPR